MGDDDDSSGSTGNSSGGSSDGSIPSTYKSVDVLETGNGEDIEFFTRSGQAYEDGKKVSVVGGSKGGGSSSR